VNIRRFFTEGYYKENSSSFYHDVMAKKDHLHWVTEDVNIIDNAGNTIFEQKDVEFPDFYSLNAMTIIASKFFKGAGENRESSLRHLAARVVNTITDYGVTAGYFNADDSHVFRDELMWIIIMQIAWLNSPVWFNLGVENSSNQCSACFILALDDTMDSIMDVANKEAFIFKEGSGTGKNLSSLRAKDENLTGGGKASGVLSFMRIYDSIAHIVKSGGKCLAPYQRVYTAKGAIPVKDLAESNEEFIVLSYDPPAGRYKAKWARAWKSGKKQVVRITTDKGVFDMSDDHPVRLSDNTVRKAGDLKPGNSLFSCSVSRDKENYLSLNLHDGNKGKELLHRLIAKDLTSLSTHSQMHADKLVETVSEENHRVVSVSKVGIMDVYSVEVDCPTADDKSPESGHNYVIWSETSDIYSGNGIAVFNSRRSAKMEILNVDHPEIVDFITCKANEEEKAVALMNAGYGDPNTYPNEAYDTVAFQNVNTSIAITDDFMDAVENDLQWDTKFVRPDLNAHKAPTFKARELLHEAAKATHRCGDPGYFYIDNINNWNTCSDKFKIKSSNPCLSADTLLHTRDGIKEIMELDGSTVDILTPDGLKKVKVFKTGVKPVFKLETTSGFELKCTSDHKIFCGEDGYVAAHDCVNRRISLVVDDVPDWNSEINQNNDLDESDFTIAGFLFGDGTYADEHHKYAAMYFSKDGEDDDVIHFVSLKLNENKDPLLSLLTERDDRCEKRVIYRSYFNHLWDFLNIDKEKIPQRTFPKTLLSASKKEIAAFLKGLFSANGSTPENTRVALKTTNRNVCTTIQKLLTLYGVFSYITTNKQKEVEFRNGVYECKESYDLNIANVRSLKKFAEHIGFIQKYKTDALIKILESTNSSGKPYTTKVKSFECIGNGCVYDFTVLGESEPAGWANGIHVHNCGEFIFCDDSACNLASINLMKFREDDLDFDVQGFIAAVKIMTITQDILINLSGYPTKEITDNSRDYRPIGLGYGNLGGLLASLGIPYDSDNGRTIASSITMLMTLTSYTVSAAIASILSPYKHYNPDTHYKVIDQHINAWKKLPKQLFTDEIQQLCNILSEKPPLRNAQVTLLAPTGTIGFAMDFESTGVEPLMGLVVYKKLSGGGHLKMATTIVRKGLEAREYTDEQIAEILEYIEDNDTMEGAPYIDDETLAVFDCAYKTKGNKRYISSDGHLMMLAATQPFLSGAISKTVSLPNEATIEDIENVVIKAHRLGLKDISIYRDGSKGVQPLSTSSTSDDKEPVIPNTPKQLNRNRMPATRPAIIHKLSVGQQEAYLSIGLYENGDVGEIFINAARTGSTINGLLDVIATLTSIALQYGVPLEVLVDKFRHTRFEPSGITNNPKIRFAGSIIDYIFTYLEQEFVSDDSDNDTREFTIEEALQHIKEITDDKIVNKNPNQSPKVGKKTTKLLKSGDVCPYCGSPDLEITGSCKTCRNCGGAGGCG